MKAPRWFLMLTVFGLLPGLAEQIDLKTIQAQAAQGDAQAEYELGRAYHTGGHGVPKDYIKAAELYQQSAAQGNAKSMYNLGYIYFHGQGVAKDGAVAAQWFQKAADLGLPAAQLEMGLYYLFGDMGLPQDYASALKWLTLAVKQQDAPIQVAAASNALGSMYEHGLGMPIDKEKTVFWYTKGAELGDSRAQSNLGRIYNEGIVVKRDKVKSYMWLKVSADREDLMATHLLPEYLAAREYKPAEIAEGTRQAKNYEITHHLPTPVITPMAVSPASLGGPAVSAPTAKQGATANTTVTPVVK